MGRDDRKRLGEVFLEHNLVTEDQINLALRRQQQQGGRIGSILLEFGFLKTDELLDFLSKQFGVPSADLYKLTISPQVLQTLPLSRMTEYRAIPVAAGPRNVFMLMSDPANEKTIATIAYELGKNVQPVVVADKQLEEALDYLRTTNPELSAPLIGAEVEKFRTNRFLSHDLDIRALITTMHKMGGAYLLLTAGVSPSIKKDSEITRLNSPPLTPEQVQTFAHQLMTDEQRREFEQFNDIDFGIMTPDLGRLRVNVFRQRNSVSIVIKTIADLIPTIQSLNLPDWLEGFALMNQGLILICGPSGHGKSATLAAIIDTINSNRRCNIITIEDPIEYLHKHKLSNVNQREVGRDTESFRQGLRRIFRQAPDVVVIGEMRDTESFSIALQAARSGQLVLSTVNANSTTAAVERIIEAFPADQQAQIRIQLADSFLLFFGQRLVQRADGAGRLPIFEKLVNSARVKKLIREGKTHQIRTVLQSSDDFEPFDASLSRLVREGKISPLDAVKYADTPSIIKGPTGR
ncbi:MAG: hypothetical protein Fur0034_19930 [Desulfuromonadia bacterium]